MSKFDDFFAGVTGGLAPLVVDFAKDARKDAVDDMLEFMARKKDDLLRWTDLLSRGEITPAEFEMLVKGQRHYSSCARCASPGSNSRACSGCATRSSTWWSRPRSGLSCRGERCSGERAGERRQPRAHGG
jgi:hypothetical protein